MIKLPSVPSAALAVLCLLVCAGPLASQGEYDVFRSSRRGEAPGMMLHAWLQDILYDKMDRRAAEIAALSTPAQVRERGEWTRRLMRNALGPDWPPAKTPLNVEVTGRFSRDNYRVEKLVYQSRPGFYVTATLYLPPESMGDGPFPAILGPCGHTMLGKAFEPYQKVYSTFASLGFVVLTYDPPGQGERFMYYDPALEYTRLGGSVVEHSMAGLQCYLTGSNAAAYFIWDGIRGIDYLLGRPEVDPERIGVTGNSGGGTLTAYIAALDDRVKAAAPTCYINTWRRMWDHYGMADAEQNLLPVIGRGFDYGDYIMPFAPRPYQVNAGIQDFFPILGARECFAEMQSVYDIFGAGDSVRLFESDEGHGYTLPRREASYQWFLRHLAGRDESPSEPPMQPEPVRELWASPTGQAATSYDDAETIHSLNAGLLEEIAAPEPGIGSPRQHAAFALELADKVKDLIRYDPYDGPLDIQFRGYARPSANAAAIERYHFTSEPGIEIPALLVKPEEPDPGLPAVLYVPDWDKADDVGGDIDRLAAAGHAVLAVDVRGRGELARPETEVRSGSFHEWFSRDWDIAMACLQLDRPLVGQRALDIVRAAAALRELTGGAEVVAVGKGAACVPLLHAALLYDRIGGVLLEGGLVGWRAMVEEELHRRRMESIVPGALATYDLAHLAAALAPRPLTLVDPTSPVGTALAPATVRERYASAAAAYGALGAPDNFFVVSRPQLMEITEVAGNTLKGAGN